MTPDMVSVQRELFNHDVLKSKEVQRAATQPLQEEDRRTVEENYTHGIFDISNDEYHSLPGISRSAITEFKKSPLHYWDKYINENKEPRTTSAAMSIGSAVHALVLEPHTFEKDFGVFRPLMIKGKKANGNSTAAQEHKKMFEAEHLGKIILKEDEFLLVQEISASVLAHPKTLKLLSQECSVEKSIFWKDKDTGIICKARPDIWNHTFKSVCDLKTTNDASLEGFLFSVRKNNYHIQAAMQIDGIFETTGEKMETFSFIASPTDRPFKPHFYMLDDKAIDKGRREYKDALKIFKKCVENKKWDLEREKVIVLEFPQYALDTDPFYNLMRIYECQQK